MCTFSNLHAEITYIFIDHNIIMNIILFIFSATTIAATAADRPLRKKEIPVLTIYALMCFQ